MFKIIDLFLKPNILNINKINNNISEIILEPMERGFGNTIGNALRRILLSSIPGYRITEIEIPNIKHEFNCILGVKEDILEIISNIKNIDLKIINENNFEYIRVIKNNIGDVFAKDISYNENILIFNYNLYLLSITENIDINIQMKVEKGIGHSYNDINKKKNNINKILIDSSFSPVKKVSYLIENTRINNRMDLDKLIIKIETNNTITPEESIKIAANILISQLDIFLDLNKFNNKSLLEKKQNINKIYNSDLFYKISKSYNNLNPILFKSIENLDLTIRSLNCLKNNNILYIGDLVQLKESSLLKMPNLGKKSLLEIKKNLLCFNLTLESNINNWNKIFDNFSKIK